LNIKHSNNVITVIYFLIILAILILFSRLFYLQIIKSDELREKAENQQKKTINLAKKILQKLKHYVLMKILICDIFLLN